MQRTLPASKEKSSFAELFDERTFFNAVVFESLRPISVAFCALYIAFAIGHLTLLPRQIGLPLFYTALVVAIVFGGVRLALWRNLIRVRYTHRVATGLALMVACSIIQHLHSSATPLQTTNLMMLIVGAGFFLLSTRWLAFFLVTAMVSWIVVMWHVSMMPDERVHFYFGMVTATVLSIVGHIARRAALRRIADLRARDRQQQRELEAARDAALESVRTKSAFLANLSHEIRTPMSGILGMNELLLNSDLKNTQRNFAVGIKSSADYLLAIINDILDFSKIEAGKIKLEIVDFNLRAMLDETLALFKERAAVKEIWIELKIGDDVPSSLRGDALRLRQVLTNLIGNAVKFTEQGSVTIEARVEKASATHVILQFSVCDTGIGIAFAEQHKLFQAFMQGDDSTTRKYGGTGLGLAISKQFVEMMGGEINFESREGEGSTFRFTARFEKHNARALADNSLARTFSTTNTSTPNANDGERILIVEDNAVNQLFLQHQLEAFGYRTAVAENGREALKKLTKDSFDLVLMDCQMPEMDGYMTVAEFRRREQTSEHSRRTPVVALTAHAMAGEREKCLAAGMDDYLSKPISAQELKLTIARWTNGFGAHHEEKREGAREIVERTKEFLKIDELFFADTAAHLAALHRAVTLERNAETARRLAHTLIGSCGFYGATEMNALCLELHKACADGDLATATNALQSLERAFKQLPRGDVKRA